MCRAGSYFRDLLYYLPIWRYTDWRRRCKAGIFYMAVVFYIDLRGHRMRPSILAMGEPIYHYMHPPVAAGIEARSREAAVFAVGQTMFDWSFVQYFIYAIPAVVFALLAYNCKRPLSFRSFVEEVTGKDRIWLTILLHIFCGYAVASGVSNSMAAGMLQISGGLNSISAFRRTRRCICLLLFL